MTVSVRDGLQVEHARMASRPEKDASGGEVASMLVDEKLI